MTLLFTYLAIAIGVSFLCSILEAVLLSITPSYVETLRAAGAVLSRVKGRLDESISSILILNTFAHTMGAAGVGSQAVQIFGVKWEVLIAVLLTLAILYFSEIT
jgi:CBS domain containing-hemolysin-like protein